MVKFISCWTYTHLRTLKMLSILVAMAWYEHWKEGHVDYRDCNWIFRSTSFFDRHIRLQLQKWNTLLNTWLACFCFSLEDFIYISTFCGQKLTSIFKVFAKEASKLFAQCIWKVILNWWSILMQKEAGFQNIELWLNTRVINFNGMLLEKCASNIFTVFLS